MPKEYRIKLQLKKPNPLFERWLEEWLNEAIKKDSLKRYVLQMALQSLRKYPLVLETGRECIILEGFGPSICKMLDKQLEKYNCDNPGVLEQTKNEQTLQIKQIYVDLQNSLQIIDNNPKVMRLQQPAEDKQENNAVFNLDVDINDDRLTTTTMAKNTFDIILLVDTQETAGKSKRSLDATIQALQKHSIKYEVKRLSVGDFAWICRLRPSIIESTSTIIDRQTNLTTTIELMLPYIIERKRMDDLAGSIRDGRFKEQKFRLTDCGISNVIYLIESHGTNKHLGLPLSNLLQATTNTQIHNEFSIKFTDSHTDSMYYISNLTKLFIHLYKNKDLIKLNDSRQYTTIIDNFSSEMLMDFSVFQKSSMKMRNFKITDLFVRQLLQLKQLTIDKALAIVDVYPTPKALRERYRLCKTEIEGERLLANIKFDSQSMNQSIIGISISKIIYQLYNTI